MIHWFFSVWVTHHHFWVSSSLGADSVSQIRPVSVFSVNFCNLSFQLIRIHSSVTEEAVLHHRIYIALPNTVCACSVYVCVWCHRRFGWWVDVVHIWLDGTLFSWWLNIYPGIHLLVLSANWRVPETTHACRAAQHNWLWICLHTHTLTSFLGYTDWATKMRWKLCVCVCVLMHVRVRSRWSGALQREHGIFSSRLMCLRLESPYQSNTHTHTHISIHPFSVSSC